MQVVVTGASGFLGNAILTLLTGHGVSCVGVSRVSSPGVLRVADYSETPVADCLIHCAEINNRWVVNSMGSAYEHQARRTLSMLMKKGFSLTVYPSSGIVYGDQWDTPRRVGDPLAIIDSYTRVKRTSEEMILASGGAVARLTNIYGPKMSSASVLSRVLEQIHRVDTISVDTLEPVRDFLWVNDASYAFARIINLGANGIFNVGSGIGVSIKELISTVQKEAGTQKAVVSFRETGQTSSIVLDINDTINKLGWAPKTDLNNGIKTLLGSHSPNLSQSL